MARLIKRLFAMIERAGKSVDASFGIGGLDTVDYVRRVETEFAVTLDEEELRTARTIGDVHELILESVSINRFEA